MNWKNCAISVALIVFALFCALIVAPVTSKPDFMNNGKYIEQIDDSIENVMKLEAGATAASAILTFMPDDQCTPIAEELAQLAKYFLVVLCSLYLEKYLIGLMGYISFRVIIPIACVVAISGIIMASDMAKSIAIRLAACGVLIYFIIPASMWCSSTIYSNYENSIDDTIEASNELSAQQVINEDENDVGGIAGILGWIKDKASTAVDYASQMLSDFIEALAVMIVTSCLIPVFVFLLFSWILRSLFDVDLTRAFVTRIGSK